MIANTLRVLALVGLWALAGHYAMQDEPVAVATDERASMVARVAEESCAGQVVMSAGRLRCAGPDTTGEMVATLIEVRQ